MLVLVSVENPLNSLAWFTGGMDDPCRREPCFVTVFARCMMGGDRDKYTKWWASRDTFRSLNVSCSRDHSHKSLLPTTLRFSWPLTTSQKQPLESRWTSSCVTQGRLYLSSAARRHGRCQCEARNCCGRSLHVIQRVPRLLPANSLLGVLFGFAFALVVPLRLALTKLTGAAWECQ